MRVGLNVAVAQAGGNRRRRLLQRQHQGLPALEEGAAEVLAASFAAALKVEPLSVGVAVPGTESEAQLLTRIALQLAAVEDVAGAAPGEVEVTVASFGEGLIAPAAIAGVDNEAEYEYVVLVVARDEGEVDQLAAVLGEAAIDGNAQPPVLVRPVTDLALA